MSSIFTRFLPQGNCFIERVVLFGENSILPLPESLESSGVSQVISWLLAGDIVRGGRLLHFDFFPLESSRTELFYKKIDRKLMILSEIAIFSIENR